MQDHYSSQNGLALNGYPALYPKLTSHAQAPQAAHQGIHCCTEWKSVHNAITADTRNSGNAKRWESAAAAKPRGRE
jgi:hypothetical protein